jgi:N-acetyl-anhydromuramyl-L-alanine amidase AmpD
MLYITKEGYVDAEKVQLKIIPNIEHEKMDVVNGIVVHQTDSSTATSTFNTYAKPRAPGAHFLIDKDGTIYQTASLYKVTWHVGDVQSRCLATLKCDATELKHAQALENIKGNQARANAVNANEGIKSWPDRYPSNKDAIGIELVGKAFDKGGKEAEYEATTEQQNTSLAWLIKELADTLGVSMQEVYRHPQVGRKNSTEASTAKW